jgi:hypothetical protein
MPNHETIPKHQISTLSMGVDEPSKRVFLNLEADTREANRHQGTVWNCPKLEVGPSLIRSVT